MRVSLLVFLVLVVACAAPPEPVDPDVGEGDAARPTPPPRGGGEMTDPYLLLVEGVECPATVAHGGDLSVRLRGHIGNNGCYRLDTITVERPDPATVVIAPYGVRGPGEICTQAIVLLDETVVISPVPETDFVVRVMRRGGEPLEFPVEVER